MKQMTTLILMLLLSSLAFASSETLSEYIDRVYVQNELEAKGLSKSVFLNGVVGFENLKRDDLVGDKQVLAILDFTQSSNNKRFYFFDLANEVLIHQTYGTHGKNSGEEYATIFSNQPETHMSSIGLYTTFDDSYIGSNGHSLRLNGHDVGFNDNAYERAIVLHGAPYATAEHIAKYGRLGRSWGCPAVPDDEVDDIIELIKEKSVLFIYSADKRYLKESRYMDRSILETIL